MLLNQIGQLKRLDLEYWQKSVWIKEERELSGLNGIATGLHQTDVIIGKEGWYYSRATKDQKSFSWFENGVEAYTTPNLDKDFEYSLKILNHVPLSERTRNAMKELLLEHYLSKPLRDIYFTDIDWNELRDVRRGVMVVKMKVIRYGFIV